MMNPETLVYALLRVYSLLLSAPWEENLVLCMYDGSARILGGPF